MPGAREQSERDNHRSGGEKHDGRHLLAAATEEHKARPGRGQRCECAPTRLAGDDADAEEADRDGQGPTPQGGPDRHHQRSGQHACRYEAGCKHVGVTGAAFQAIGGAFDRAAAEVPVGQTEDHRRSGADHHAQHHKLDGPGVAQRAGDHQEQRRYSPPVPDVGEDEAAILGPQRRERQPCDKCAHRPHEPPVPAQHDRVAQTAEEPGEPDRCE